MRHESHGLRLLFSSKTQDRADHEKNGFVGSYRNRILQVYGATCEPCSSYETAVIACADIIFGTTVHVLRKSKESPTFDADDARRKRISTMRSVFHDRPQFRRLLLLITIKECCDTEFTEYLLYTFTCLKQNRKDRTTYAHFVSRRSSDS